MADEAAVAPKEVCEVAALLVGVREAPPREGNGDFEAESPPAEGILNMEGAPLEAGAGAPNAGLGVLSVAVDGVESAGLENMLRPPVAGGAEGVPPSTGFWGVELGADPNRPPDGCDCAVAGVVESERPEEDAGVFDEAAFIPLKRPELGLDPGGGPAGVVEVFPNREPPAGPGVADALFPNKLPPEFGLLLSAPNSPPVAGCPEVVDSVVLLGVWALPNIAEVPPGVLLPLLFPVPKLKPELPLAGLAAPPKRDG